jgi:hypothetical protein
MRMTSFVSQLREGVWVFGENMLKWILDVEWWSDRNDGENYTVKIIIYTLRKVLSRRMQWAGKTDGMEELEMHTKL